MNKLKSVFPVITLLLLLIPTLSMATPTSIGDEFDMRTDETKEAYLDRLQDKADDIMVELKTLKKEKKAAKSKAEKEMIKDEANALNADLEALDAKAQAVGGGIYIGGGALIVILLLILLL